MFKCSFLYFKFKVNYLNALIHLKAKTVQGGTSFSWIRHRNSIQAVSGIQLFRSGCGVCAVGGYGDVSAGGVCAGFGDVGAGGLKAGDVGVFDLGFGDVGVGGIGDGGGVCAGFGDVGPGGIGGGVGVEEGGVGV